MIQYKQILITLALLLTAVTGAWAQSYEAKVFDVPASWAEDNTHISAADLPKDFVQITKDEVKALAVPDGTGLLIYGFVGENVLMMQFDSGTFIPDEEDDDGAPESRGNFIVFQTYFNAKICYTAPGGPKVAWDAATKTGTFTMPGYDVELIPEYYPGMLTLGSGAIEGGKLEVVGLTDTTLPAGFEKDEEGNIYVKPGTEFKVKVVPNEGYRLVSLTDGTNDIKVDADGIATITMPDEYADLTLTVTFSDKFTVALNAEGLSDEEAAAWKAATGDNDPAAFPLENVKYGTEVKVTYTGTRKVIGVKAEKKAATPATPAETTVTWNSENISFLQLYEPSAPFTMMGIKLSTSSMSNTADWRNIGIPTNDGLYFDVTTTGGYTFTAPSGKKFTKIEMTVTNANGWTQALFQNTLGTGWPSGEDAVSVVEDTKKVTWTGTAASTVGLLTDASFFNASPVTSIVFTLVDAE